MTPENLKTLLRLDYFMWIEPCDELLQGGTVQYDYSGMWRISLSDMNKSRAIQITTVTEFDKQEDVFQGDGGPWHLIHIAMMPDDMLAEVLNRVEAGEIVDLGGYDGIVDGTNLLAKDKNALYMVAANKLNMPINVLERMFDYTNSPLSI